MNDECLTYDAWAAEEAKMLASGLAEDVDSLYRAARRGDKEAKRELAKIAIANAVGTLRPMTEREQKADRAFKILYWLRQNTVSQNKCPMTEHIIGRNPHSSIV